MYLKKLFNTNKWWFAAISLFIIVQLAMDVRHDIALSPVYHYGMYSEIIAPQAKYVLPVITVNGRMLRARDFTPQQWDKIFFTIELFHKQQAWNSSQWNTDIKRLLHVTDSCKYINNTSEAQFNEWYKNYLQTILHKNVDSVRVDFAEYGFNGTTLTKIPR